MDWKWFLSEGMLVQSIITILLVVAWVAFIALGVAYPESFDTILKIVIGVWFGSASTVASLRIAGKLN